MKILLLDLETSPILGRAWGAYETNLIEIIEPTKILAVGWGWYEDDKVHSVADPDERRLVDILWGLLNEADVVVAHNGDKFDLRNSNARFLAYGLKPPKPYKSVDTLKVARKYFKLDRNKLDYLAEFLGVGRKIGNNNYAAWKDARAGDKAALKMVEEYNAQDVVVLKDVYTVLRPWVTNHPNVSAYNKIDGSACPKCASNNTQRRGFSVLKERIKQRFQCRDCGGWFSGAYAKAEELKCD